MLSTKVSIYTFLAILIHSARAQNIAAQVASLRNAATEVDRLQLLNDSNVRTDKVKNLFII